MPYTIAASESGSYIRVTVTGEMTRELAADAGINATKLGDEAGVARYLYDMRESRNAESVLSNYQFANDDMPQLDLNRAARVALLVAEDDRSHDFVVTAIRNAGFLTRLFEDESEAIAWLEAERLSTDDSAWPPRRSSRHLKDSL